MNMPQRIAQIAEQNAAMRRALEVIRENECLREALGARGIPVEEAPQSMAAITELVAARYSCSAGELRGTSKIRGIAWPRQEAMWMMRQVKAADGSPRFSLTQIGRYFGDRDHTTVLHAERAHARRALAQQEAA